MLRMLAKSTYVHDARTSCLEPAAWKASVVVL